MFSLKVSAYTGDPIKYEKNDQIVVNIEEKHYL